MPVRPVGPSASMQHQTTMNRSLLHFNLLQSNLPLLKVIAHQTSSRILFPLRCARAHTQTQTKAHKQRQAFSLLFPLSAEDNTSKRVKPLWKLFFPVASFSFKQSTPNSSPSSASSSYKYAFFRFATEPVKDCLTAQARSFFFFAFFFFEHCRFHAIVPFISSNFPARYVFRCDGESE